MTLEEFQDRHGVQFGQLLKIPAFNEALIFLSLQVCERIKLLEDAEIRDNSAIILADLRGRLRHEFELLSLPVPQEAPTESLTEEYVDQTQEAFDQFNQRHKRP